MDWEGNYRDPLTGYEGAAVARTEYRYSTPQLCLVRRDTAGKPEEVWFQEARLDRLPVSRAATAGFGSETTTVG